MGLSCQTTLHHNVCMDEETPGQLQFLSRDPKREQGEQQHPRGPEEVAAKLVLEGERSI